MSDKDPQDKTALVESEAGKPEVVEEDQPAPPAFQRKVTEMMMAISGGGPRYHPIFEKFESKHVDAFLQHVHEDDVDERNIRKSNRWFRFAYFVVGLVAFGFLTYFLLPEHETLYLEFLKLGVVFAAGVGSGYGLKSYLDHRSH